MRALLFFAIAVGFASHLTASAQAPGPLAAASEVDFSGAYVSGVPIESPVYTEPDVYPFTAVGERAHRAYDPLVADPQQVDDCAPEAIPAILWSRNPMQIDQEEGRIVIRFESGDTTRSIHLDGTSPATGQDHTETGFSTGHWVGTELKIETTHLIDGVITNGGYPISRDARMIERYWRNPGQKNLQMELVVDDPVNYTQPVTLGREFVWTSKDQVRPWECISLGPRDSEPDIDELARMLEEL